MSSLHRPVTVAVDRDMNVGSENPNQQARGSDQHSADICPPGSLTQSSDVCHPLSYQYHCEHCGRKYTTLHHLESHQRSSCDHSKRKISELLASTKEFWASRKRQRSSHDLTPTNHEANSGTPLAQVEPTDERMDTSASNSSRRLSVSNAIGTASLNTDPTTRVPYQPQNVPELASSSSSSNGNSMTAQDLDVPVAIRKAKRDRRAPARYRHDDLPQALPSVEAVDNEPADDRTGEPKTVRRRACPMKVQKSKRNTFGVVRAYRLPRGSTLTHDPDNALTLRDLTDSTPTKAVEAIVYVPPQPGIGLGPFPSHSAFSLADWYWQLRNKSFADFQKLISVFKQPDFSLNDIVCVDWKSTFKALGANREDLPGPEGQWIQDDGWKKTPVTIDVPFHNRMRKPGVESYIAGTFHHRSIVSVIKEKISNTNDSWSFHYQPYTATWKPSDEAPEVELYGELYSSHAFREANSEIQALPGSPDNQGLERVVVALMFWSDGTQLTLFGGASLWPCYLFFGNESKYRRCQPLVRLGEQIAYFIKLSDAFSDYLQKRNDGKLPTDGLFTHCARELFQQQWGILLDEELLDAMKNGLILLCPDGRLRCFYPRIFTYSADYPEKTLVAGLRNNGGCPCHRCLIEKGDIWKLGAPSDTDRQDRVRSKKESKRQVDLAREEIAAGFAVDGARIDLHLKTQSLVPVHNAFSAKLSGTNFSIAPALAVDLMHEFEIGVWKRLFIHLIRLLDAFTAMDRQGSTLTGDLDYRYRATPPFGRNSIRSFEENASEMKRRAARDYEDLLQCSIPAFDSLLPGKHNMSLMKLLYIFCQWHALAKLRMHHDGTLQLLDYTTTCLGAQMRLFNHETCKNTPTKELRQESEARERREGKGNGKGNSTRKPVKFNIYTIKFHFLGDYSDTIRFFGTTDSFSTETGELFHRLPKSWFKRTDRREYEGQLSQIERRQARLEQIRRVSKPSSNGVEGDSALALSPSQAKELDGPHAASTAKVQSEPDPTDTGEDSPDRRYVIGKSQNSPLSLSLFSRDLNINTGEAEPQPDPYIPNFVNNLKQHLFLRVIERLGYSASAFQEPEDDWVRTTLSGHRIYSHQLLRINYTTYDVRRDQDIIHVGTPPCNAMLLNDEFTQNPTTTSGVHPFLYGKVLGVYHGNVSYVGFLPDGTRNLASHRIDFAWVHWYEFLQSEEEFTLDRLSLKSLDSDQALGFVDPSDILRGVHVILQFSLGRPVPTPPQSNLLPAQDTWNAYFINRFADRDLFMRYQYGMAVGHTYMHRTPANTPSIPANFDHHTSFPEEEESEGEQDDNYVCPDSGDESGGELAED